MDSFLFENRYSPGGGMDPPHERDLPLRKLQALYETFGGVAYEWCHLADRFTWSQQCAKMFGLSPGEMGAGLQSWLTNVHPQDRDGVLSSRSEILRTGQASSIEYRVRHGSGYFIWVRDYLHLGEQGEDGTCNIIGYLQNRTEIKQRQKELELARRAIDSSINAIAFTDLNGHLTYVNQSFLAMVGYECADRIMGRQVGDFWENPKKARVVLRNLQKYGEWSGEVQANRPDGCRVYFEVSAHVVEDSEGEPLCYMASFLDMSEQKQAEQELQESEEKYRLLFSTCSDAVVIFDARTYRVVDINEAALALYGYSRDEFLALDVLDLSEEPEQSHLRMEQIINGTRRHFSMVSHRRKDGSVMDVEVSIGRFTWKKRHVFAGFFRDVSERRRIEQMKDDMLSAVSHEMRTPLTAILGFTDYLLKSGTAPDGQKEYLDIIHQQSERLKDLVENHLNLQRLRAGCGVGSIHPVEILPMLHGVLNMFHAGCGRDRIRIAYNEALPPVRGVENQLYRALYNLLSNAIKYSSEDEEVVLGAYRDHDAAILYVKDRGVGIPEQHQATIFERFFQVQYEQHGIRGTGLGLSLVQEIVKAHNGRIWLDSAPGQGSCFYLRLPFAD